MVPGVLQRFPRARRVQGRGIQARRGWQRWRAIGDRCLSGWRGAPRAASEAPVERRRVVRRRRVRGDVDGENVQFGGDRARLERVHIHQARLRVSRPDRSPLGCGPPHGLGRSRPLRPALDGPCPRSESRNRRTARECRPGRRVRLPVGFPRDAGRWVVWDQRGGTARDAEGRGGSDSRSVGFLWRVGCGTK